MPLNKSERKQLNRYLDGVTSSADTPAIAETGGLEPLPDAGAPAPVREAGETEEHFQARVRRHQNLQKWQDQFNEAFFTGMFGVETLQPIDMVYIDSVQERYKLKTGKDIMRDGIIGGKNIHLNQVRKNGDALRGQFDLSTYDSPIKQEVERRLA